MGMGQNEKIVGMRREAMSLGNETSATSTVVSCNVTESSILTDLAHYVT